MRAGSRRWNVACYQKLQMGAQLRLQSLSVITATVLSVGAAALAAPTSLQLELLRRCWSCTQRPAAGAAAGAAALLGPYLARRGAHLASFWPRMKVTLSVALASVPWLWNHSQSM